MSIDLSQFKQTFLEESDEGLDVLESGLLALDSGEADDEVIHAVFRAAHSIKGGAGTFSLNEIASFTHVMETLLDEMRDGRRAISKEGINLLLNSVDVLRELMEAARDDVVPEMSRANEVQHELNALLAQQDNSENNEPPNTNAIVETEQTNNLANESDSMSSWQIDFRPHEHLLKTGNDTVRIFKELASLGDFSIQANGDSIPELAHMDPELSYMSWQITISENSQQGKIEQSAIDEIFEWVLDDCDLIIKAIEVNNNEISNSITSETNEKVSAKTEEVINQNVTPISASNNNQNESNKTSVAKKKKSSSEGGSIRVGTDKVDSLINMVGELVITQSMLSQMGEDFTMDKLESLREGLAQLERNTRELQESVMRIRMLPISFSFQRFPRLVHDLSQKMSKKIELKMTGEQTELDKTVMEKIGDPMVHLVRNSLDHGIELPEVRLAAGKSEMGTINLNAYHQGGFIVIEISDDGAGLPKDKLLAKAIEKGLVESNEQISDEKIYDLIFHPGFSTADKVSDISGRGVGMDVVRKNIKELGGKVEVNTEPGQGTTFTIRLPLTLAILDGQLIRVGNETYIIPLVSIIESLEIETQNINTIAGTTEVYKMRDEYIPVVRLHEIFDVMPLTTRMQDCLLVVVEGEGGKAGILVDDLLSQQQVVIKSLETNYKRLEGISGATILGDGTVALILDMSGVLNMAKEPEVIENYA